LPVYVTHATGQLPSRQPQSRSSSQRRISHL
jgi:hypothetical protein